MALRLTTPAAIVLGSAIIASSIIGSHLMPSYRLVPGGIGPYRIETRSGSVVRCSAGISTSVPCGAMAGP